MKCAVPGCDADAVAEVILFDVYVNEPVDAADEWDDSLLFFARDVTCPFICGPHLMANERRADGTREPRGWVRYPFTNQHGAQGFTVYRPVQAQPPPKPDDGR